MQEVVVGSERLAVGKLIGKGGEGEVFALSDRTDLAIKIYSSGLRKKREEKVRAMVHQELYGKTDLVAYPGEIVSDLRGNFLGFLMRLVSGYRPVHELYSPKSRQRHFPEADYRFVIRAALNVARGIGKVHQTGCVIGDLNHSGVLVSQKATVALIDADSFQFRLGSRTYPCSVGVPEFTPPELHGIDLGTVERTVDHDNFGLAVAIFHLLFMGRHPYAGRYQGPDISMAEAIAQNRFAFSLARRSSTKTSPPPGAPTLDLFPDHVRDAFELAFGLDPAARSGALEWTAALTKLEGSLSRCSKVRSHYYPSSSKGCVWCSLAEKSAFDMFPDLSAVSPDIPTDTRGIEQAIQEISGFRLPPVLDLLPQSAVNKPRSSRTLRNAKNAVHKRAATGALMIVGAGVALYVATPAWFIWLGLAAWGWTLLSDREVSATPFRDALAKADDGVQRELDTFVRRSGLMEIVRARSDLDTAVASYRSVDDEQAQALTRLKSSREARQRTAFLDRFSIRTANISGIGPARTATLISFGIETAADVNQSAVLRVPGFGDVMTAELIDWRRKHEAQFRYNPTPNTQDTVAERALRAKFAKKKADLGSTIRNGANALRTAKSSLLELPARARADRGLKRVLEERAQAVADLEALGESIPTSNFSLRIDAQPQPKPVSQGAKATTSTSQSASAPKCPQCGASMIRRTARQGRRVGHRFWGCSRYPHCRGTRN